MLYRIPPAAKLLYGSDQLSIQPVSIFSERRLDFLADLMRDVLASKNFSDEVTAFAFGFRSRELEHLKNKFKNERRVGRGLAFHISPTNVQVTALYSLFLSFLSGNANIVRLPSTVDDQLVSFLNLMQEKLSKSFADLRDQFAIISYDFNNAGVVKNLYLNSDIRILWGGNEKIRSLRAVESKIKSVELSFSTKNSIAIFDARQLRLLDENSRKEFVYKFYLDTMKYDQLACSSAKIVFWLNGQDAEDAIDFFWKCLKIYTKEKGSPSFYFSSQKYEKLALFLMKYGNGIDSMIDPFEPITRIQVNKNLPNTALGESGLGNFLEKKIEGLEEIISYVGEDVQTCVYFGFDPLKLAELINNAHIMGVDRVVPVGQALKMDNIWDGIDIISSCSRIIDIR
jgi:hypothetical protein